MMLAATPSKACMAPLRAPKGRISARSVRAQYKVTFVYPDGDAVDIECPGDRYMLDVAEVRSQRIYAFPASAPLRCRNRLQCCTNNIHLDTLEAAFAVSGEPAELPGVSNVDTNVAYEREVAPRRNSPSINTSSYICDVGVLLDGLACPVNSRSTPIVRYREAREPTLQPFQWFA